MTVRSRSGERPKELPLNLPPRVSVSTGAMCSSWCSAWITGSPLTRSSAPEADPEVKSCLKNKTKEAAELPMVICGNKNDHGERCRQVPTTEAELLVSGDGNCAYFGGVGQEEHQR